MNEKEKRKEVQEFYKRWNVWLGLIWRSDREL